MKFSEKWLREWVDPDISSEELSEQLTMAGLEVDGMEVLVNKLPGIVTARVESAEPHPNSNKLSICQVNYGATETVTVVCGAPNVFTGHHYPYAGIGAVLPDGTEISAREIAGVESQGMLCSELELRLGDNGEGLLQLDKDAALGVSISEYLEIDDVIYELSLTPNRGDCLSIHGIAREVGVLNNIALNLASIDTAPVSTDAVRQIMLEAPSACPHYVGRVIPGIDITRPTPDWMRERLRRCGIRSINIIVDITHLVLLELGQPMHAFDNDKLEGPIKVKQAGEGETLQLLDGKDCEINPGTLLITDDSGPVALAGVMGGMPTSVTDTTRNIFLESAYFNPDAIAGRARSYGLHTEASHRYERGVDFALQVKAMERATGLIQTYCGGDAGAVVDAIEVSHLPERNLIILRQQSIHKILGLNIAPEKITTMLKRLDMEVSATDEGWAVTPPSFRFDIEKEIDLIEEVARIYGYDNIPLDTPRPQGHIIPLTRSVDVNALKVCLHERGYSEAITYSFVNRTLQQAVLDQDGQIPLHNPISADMDVMRQSLLPGLLQVVSYNDKRQQTRIRVFEHGMIFTAQDGIQQENVFTAVTCGKLYEKQLDIDNLSCDLSDIKADLQALLLKIAPRLDLAYVAVDHHALHPGQSAKIMLDNQETGFMGAVHPGLLSRLEIKHDVYMFEIKMSAFSEKNSLKYAKFSKFPYIRRDIAILVDHQIPLEKILECTKSASSEALQNLELFDVYQGEGIDIKKKSLALGLTFQGTSSNLTDEEVDGQVNGILKALNKAFGATLRE